MTIMDDRLTAVRAGMALDAARLEFWLQAHVAGFEGPLTVRQFSGGQSNPTYLLQTPQRRYVLRRKPPGVLLPSAHAVDREYRVIDALSRTDVPVPKPLALCTDEQVIGTWFYVMEHVEGRIFWDPRLPEVPQAQRRPVYAAMIDVIARLHRLDRRALNLEDFGKPSQYMARQIARWGRQYREDESAGRVDDMDRLIDWLQAHAPVDDEAAIVHGDFRCDNLIFDPVEPRVLAILDWELATIGHPLADFAYFLMIHRLPSLAFPGLAGVDLPGHGLPTEDECVAMYCERTGRDEFPHRDFFVAFCIFRLAAILHGIRGRVLRGTAANPRAQEYARHVEAVAAVGWRQVAG
jgi:aminoglycoside phosphotransferase (APT) family kinase protein